MADKKIYSKVDTMSNLIANLEAQMRGIDTDGSRNWCYKDSQGTPRLHVTANQKYWNGSAWIYEDNWFKDLYIEKIKSQSGTAQISIGATSLSISPAGVARAYFTNSGLGLGFGMSNPSFPLEINGDSKVRANSIWDSGTTATVPLAPISIVSPDTSGFTSIALESGTRTANERTAFGLIRNESFLMQSLGHTKNIANGTVTHDYYNTSTTGDSGLAINVAMQSVGSKTSIGNASKIYSIFNNSVRRFGIDGDGTTYVGTASARRYMGGDATTSYGSSLHVEGTQIGYASIGVINNDSNGFPSALYLGASSSGSVGGNGAVQSGDAVGMIEFCAANGTDMQRTIARIQSKTTATASGSSTPGSLIFSTTKSGSFTPTDRLTIGSDGAFNFSSDLLRVDNIATSGGPELNLYSNASSSPTASISLNIGTGPYTSFSIDATGSLTTNDLATGTGNTGVSILSGINGTILADTDPLLRVSNWSSSTLKLYGNGDLTLKSTSNSTTPIITLMSSDNTPNLTLSYSGLTISSLTVATSPVISISQSGIDITGTSTSATPSISLRASDGYPITEISASNAGVLIRTTYSTTADHYDQISTYGNDLTLTADGTINQYDIVTALGTSANYRVRACPTSGDGQSMPVGVAQNAASAGEYVRVRITGYSYVNSYGNVSRGQVLVTGSTTAGTVEGLSTVPVDTIHFREVGHAMAERTGNGIVYSFLHFN
jgi:hypothetical protein